MKRRLLGLLALALGQFLALAFTPPDSRVAASAAIVWGTPTPIGQDLNRSWFPDITADPTGKVLLIWDGMPVREADDSRVTSGVYISQSTPQGWTAPVDIQATDWEHAGRTVIASDGRWVHVLYRKEVRASYQPVRLWYVRAPAGADLADARSWSEPQPMSEDMSYYSQIALLPNGEILCVFNQILPSGTAGEQRRMGLFARRSSDDGATWTTPVRVSDTQEQVARSGVVLSPDQQTLIAFWDEGYENMSGLGEVGQVSTARSADSGRTWTDQQRITSPTGPIEQSFVASTPSGPILVYRPTTADKLLYRTSDDAGKSWSNEREIPGVIARPYTGKHHFDRFSLATDSAGRAVLAYVGQDRGAPKGLAVMTASYIGGEWAAPERVAAPDGYPEYARLAVALGNRLQLTYFVRPQQFDAGHSVVYVVAGQSDAPPLPATSPPVGPVSAPTASAPAVPAVQIQSHPPLPPAPTPLAASNGPLLTPQAEVTRPALGSLLATLAALGMVVPILLISRWLRLSSG